MTPLPKRTLEWMLKVKSSYNFLTKASSKRFRGTKIKWDQNVLEPKFFSIYNQI